MTFFLRTCDSKSVWLNTSLKWWLSRTLAGAEDEAMLMVEWRLPTPNLNGIHVGFGSVNTPKYGLGVGILCSVSVPTLRRGVPRLGMAVFGPGTKVGRLGVEGHA
ncbi:hypothetical protein PIB30_093301 [Stylosanthes scabra]|uniref:Uncharacterized protein n=1 Tax=Stylosanthes scabra TaxID=79078 RepID=A0ABU6UTX9_9FABA|nr:hypothetical protein [Stylosanthes scabra]